MTHPIDDWMLTPGFEYDSVQSPLREISAAMDGIDWKSIREAVTEFGREQYDRGRRVGYMQGFQRELWSEDV